jgi:hypothetical protein
VTLLAEPFNGGCGYEMSHATKRIEQIAISASATEAPTLFVLCRGRTGAVTPGAD